MICEEKLQISLFDGFQTWVHEGL